MLFIPFFIFWVILSQKFDAVHLLEGVFFSAITAIVARKYLIPHNYLFRRPSEIMRLIAFLPWLFWQIIMSNLKMVKIILLPSMPIKPSICKFHFPLSSDFARFVLANAITLTPGTVTIDIENEHYLVHTLTEGTSNDLNNYQPSGSLQNRVRNIFRD